MEALAQHADHVSERRLVRDVAGKRLPRDGPPVGVADDADHELGQVAAAVTRVAPSPPGRLRVPPDVRARGVEVHDVEIRLEGASAGADAEVKVVLDRGGRRYRRAADLPPVD